MISYGGRQDIVDAIKAGALTEEQITKYFNDMAPEPDVIVRTGGRTRLSNFMLWQAAYSELFFVDTLFPDFGE
jgi:undecaprenyl diphosphate synthase